MDLDNIPCPMCGIEIILTSEMSTTTMGYIRTDAHNHNPNTVTRSWTCPDCLSKGSVAYINKCSVDNCDYGKIISIDVWDHKEK